MSRAMLLRREILFKRQSELNSKLESHKDAVRAMEHALQERPTMLDNIPGWRLDKLAEARSRLARLTRAVDMIQTEIGILDARIASIGNPVGRKRRSGKHDGV
ncbi:MAG TPA: hypothetical protein VM659_11735 [Dongiaceae bacterium]|nr:hypothetical protein [Dongiaceae bacterium]